MDGKRKIPVDLSTKDEKTKVPKVNDLTNVSFESLLEMDEDEIREVSRVKALIVDHLK